ncbi:MAG: hypothetical protein IJJ26_01365 [Victivallales bacterium]|nr:hypothetical protein [Victivallales bacterium]
MKHRFLAVVLTCVLSLLPLARAQEGWKLAFTEGKSPLETLSLVQGGKTLTFEKGLLCTKESNAILLDKREQTDGRVTLTAETRNKGTVELVARALAEGSAYYSLRAHANKKTVSFTRFMPNALQRFTHDFAYDGAALVTLSLEFAGGKIIPSCNGKKLGEFEDDGKLLSGACGVRLPYWSQVALKSLEFSGAAGAAPAKPAVSPQAKWTLEPKASIVKSLDWDLKRAAKSVKGQHVAVCLNQVWRFQAVKNYLDKPDEADAKWGYLVVPGYWAKAYHSVNVHNAEGVRVNEWNGFKYHNAGIGGWYRRTFDVPADWTNKHAELLFQDVIGKATVFLNGERVAEKGDPAINIIRADVTGKLKPGRNELRFAQTNESKKNAGLRNVYLTLRPKENLGHPSVATSVAKKQFTLRCHDAEVKPGRTLKLQVKGEDGKSLFQKEVPYQKETRFSWLPEHLWTPDDPALYTLETTLLDNQGKVLDSTTTRVGFREFVIVGSQYLLNGNPISLKANTALFPKTTPWGLDYLNDPVYFRGELALYKALGLNCGYLSESPNDDQLEVADEVGVMLIVRGQMLGHGPLNSDFPGAMVSLEQNLKTMARNYAFYRHPSIIGILLDVWYNYEPGTVNPAFSGQPEKDPNLKTPPWSLRVERLNQISSLYKKYFPGYEQFCGACALVDKVYSTHLYQTWGAPSAELRSFLEDWAANRKHPIFVGETCIPYIGSFFDLENFHGGGKAYVTEQASRVLGDEGYYYRSSRTERPFHDRSKFGWRWNSTEPKDSGEYGFNPDAPVSVLETYIREIMPGWKYHGLAGWGTFEVPVFAFASQGINSKDMIFPTDYSGPGIKPESTDNGNAVRPFYDIRNLDGRYDLRPTVIFAPIKRIFDNVSMDIFDKLSDPLLQNHSGFSGTSFEKSVVVYNETGDPLSGKLDVVLLDNQGQRLPAASQNVSVKPFDRAHLPVAFTLPEVENREEWTMQATLTLPGKVLRDAMAVQIFPKPRIVNIASPVYLFDPEGVLSQKLEGHLKATRLTTLQKLPKEGLLIVGRGAMRDSKAQAIDWEQAASQGLNILFMEQFQDASLELLKERSRRVFVNAPAHPVFDGLQDADFQYWLDAHSVAPAKGTPVVGSNWTDWGNRNMVSSFAFRRQQHGNFLSLLTCGFDLFKSPLLEYRGSKGHWLASQLEITERLGSDPVATRVFDNMVRYLAHKSAPAEKPLFYGGKSGQAFLAKFGISCQEVGKLDAETLAQGNVLLVASPESWEELKYRRRELCEFVYWGGTVFFLNTGHEFSPAWLPFTMKLEKVMANQAKVQGTPDGLWRNGFGNSELYWRDNLAIPAFKDFPPHFLATDPAVLLKAPFGKGQWLFASITPDDFTKPEHAAAQGKTVRLFSALFTSLCIPVKTKASFPFKSICAEAEADFSEQKWEFSIDPKNVGLREKWQNGERGTGSWISGLVADGVEVRLGQPFENFIRKEYDGVVWYRLLFNANENLRAQKKLFFSAGAIDDLDEVYLNGVKIGQTGESTPNYWKIQRNYPIPEGLLKPSDNILAVRVTDLRGTGGILGMPVRISTQPLTSQQNIWISPWPEGQKRDYTLKPDIVRSY